MLFKDRQEAGQLLGKRLKEFRFVDPLILALPRGGVVVALEVARTLEAPLDALIVRKLGAPGNREFGMGAITEGDSYWLDDSTLKALGVTHDEINRVLLQESDEVRRRAELYRKNRPLPSLQNRDVILVDDGLATGVTAFTAIRWLKQNGARRIVLAVPVCAPESAENLEREVEVLCLEKPENFQAVSRWYEKFKQTSDEEVIQMLSQPSLGTQAQVILRDGSVQLRGTLTITPENKGIILFAHGSGSSRLSPRNQKVASDLNQAGFSTLLFDLLTPGEADRRASVFDIDLLASRLVMATRWLAFDERLKNLPIGYFGASTGAAAALVAAAELGHQINAVVSRGGRPDLAMAHLKNVSAPTLLIVGSKDDPVIELNESALQELQSGSTEAKLLLVPGATHLFEEPGTLEKVSHLASAWFLKHLTRAQKKMAA